MSKMHIECGRHGASPACFACTHLLEGERLGVRLGSEPTEAWPDAICDTCAIEPDWSHAAAVDRIRTVCRSCWEDVFARNTKVEPDEDAADWIEDARHRANERQESWLERFAIARFPHFQMELGGDVPWFGVGESATRIHVRSDVLVIGTWSRRSHTWLWGWGNDSVEAHLTNPVIAVKRFGEANGLERLWRMSCDASEEDAFGLAATALHLLPILEGVYRAPGENLSTFLGVTNTRYVV